MELTLFIVLYDRFKMFEEFLLRNNHMYMFLKLQYIIKYTHQSKKPKEMDDWNVCQTKVTSNIVTTSDLMNTNLSL